MNKRLQITRDASFDASPSGDTKNDGFNLEGYAAVFGQPTRINSFEGNFTESIQRGAFSKTLSEKKPICQYQHGRDSRTGSVPIGVFSELSEDEHGLRVKARLFDNEAVKPVRQAVEAGAISGMSFTFQVIRDSWTDDKGNAITGRDLQKRLFDTRDNTLHRVIKEVRLMEAGPVSSPAYEGTSVGVRGAEDMDEPERQEIITEYCRSAGLVADLKLPDVDLERWLTAENTWRWLDAELTYRWLTAETEFRNSHTNQKLNTETKSGDTKVVVRDTLAVEGATQDKAGHSTTLKRDQKKVEPNGAKKVSETRIKIMTLAELRERLAIISVRMEEINTEYRDADLPEDVDTEFEAMKSERTATETKIAKIEARLAEFKDSARDTKRVEGKSPAFINRDADKIFDIEAIRRDSHNEEDLSSRLRDNAMRAAEVVKFGGGSKVNREDAQGQIQHFLDDKDDANSTFAKRVLVTGSPAYERAWSKALAAGSAQILYGEEARALSLGVDNATGSGGGYAVPIQLDPTVIWTSAGVINPLRQIARVEQIVGKEWQGITSAGTTVTRSAEAAAAGDNSFTLAQKAVRTNRVSGFIPFSYELAESWSQVRSEITAALVDAKGREEATSFVTGDGTGVNAGGLVGSLVGNLVATGGTTTFTAANLYALETALDPRYRGNGKFLAHRAIYNLIRQFDTAGGAQLWERVGAGLPSQLLGYDALESSVMDSVVTSAKKIAVFGDFSNFLIVDRIGMSVELIPQVFDTTNNRPTGQRGIYAIWMNNSTVLVDASFKVLSATT